MRLIGAAALLTGLFVSWLGFAVAGWRGAIEGLCLVLVVAALSGRAALTDRRAAIPRPSPARAGAEYPDFQQASAGVRGALNDGRYFDRVLASRLRRLAGDLVAHRRGREPSEVELASQLGPVAWQLLTPAQPPRDRDEPVTAEELDAVLSAIERL